MKAKTPQPYINAQTSTLDVVVSLLLTGEEKASPGSDLIYTVGTTRYIIVAVFVLCVDRFSLVVMSCFFASIVVVFIFLVITFRMSCGQPTNLGLNFSNVTLHLLTLWNCFVSLSMYWKVDVWRWTFWMTIGGYCFVEQFVYYWC